MPNEEAFNCWCLFNQEDKGISLNSYEGLGLKYVCSLFNSNAIACHVLQFGTQKIVDSLAYLQSWRAYLNPNDRSQAQFLLWLEFPTLPADMHTFIDFFSCQFGKVHILDGQHNSLYVNLRVCVDVDLKHKFPPFIFACTIDGVRQQKVRYHNLPNVCFACQADDRFIWDCLVRHPRTRYTGEGGSITPPSSHGMAIGGTLVDLGQGVGIRGPSLEIGVSSNGLGAIGIPFGGLGVVGMTFVWTPSGLMIQHANQASGSSIGLPRWVPIMRDITLVVMGKMTFEGRWT